MLRHREDRELMLCGVSKDCKRCCVCDLSNMFREESIAYEPYEHWEEFAAG